MTCGSLASAQSFGGSLLEHIERRGRDDVGVDGAVQGVRIDEIPARRVDEPQPALAAREALVIEEVSRFGRGRQVQRHVIGGRAHLVQREQLDAEPRGDLGRDEGIVGDHAHAKRPGALRHFLADASQARDAERLAAQLGAEEPALLPALVFHGPIGGRHRSCERQHQRQGVFGDADAVGAGRIDHDNPAARWRRRRRRCRRRSRRGRRCGAGERRRAGARRPWSRCGPAARRRRRGRPRDPQAIGRTRASTAQPGSARSSATAEAGRSSATTIFNGISTDRCCGRS